jgi:hypothetical protein
MKTERRESLENNNVTAEPMPLWRRPPSCREVSNTRTGGEHRGSGDGMSAKEQVVNTGSPIRREERSQPEIREEQAGPNRVAERSVLAMRRVTIVEQRGLSSRSTQKQQEPGRLTRVYQPHNGSVLQRALYAQAKTSPSYFGPTCAKARYLVRKPGAGDPHARFDERDLETELLVTAPDLDSTRRGGKDAGYAANGTLAFRAVAGFETKSAKRVKLQEWF